MPHKYQSNIRYVKTNNIIIQNEFNTRSFSLPLILSNIKLRTSQVISMATVIAMTHAMHEERRWQAKRDAWLMSIPRLGVWVLRHQYYLDN